MKAIDLGATEPGVVRREFVLLYELQEFDQIDQLVSKLGERGLAPDELKLFTAAARPHGDPDRAVVLARQVLPETSKNPSDLLVLCRNLLRAGRVDQAEKPLRRVNALARVGPRPGSPR